MDVLATPRFFRVVNPVPTLMWGAMVTAGGVAALAMVLDPALGGDVLRPVLVLHVFAASSGFAGPARRGYYDLPLTRGDSRLLIALTHWSVSIAPGLAVWLAVAAVEALARPGLPSQTLAGGTCVAMAVTSMVAWATTVGLPRFTGAIGWMAVVSAVGSVWPLDALIVDGWPVVRALAALVNPALLIGRSLTWDAMSTATPALLVGMAAMVCACAWVTVADFRLEASQ